MKRTLTLIAVLCLVALAADNAAVATQQAASRKPQATSTEPQPADFVAAAIAIPQMMSYQGKLTDTLGSPVEDTTHSVEFRLYTTPSGGSPFWSETQDVTTKDG